MSVAMVMFLIVAIAMHKEQNPIGVAALDCYQQCGISCATATGIDIGCLNACVKQCHHRNRVTEASDEKLSK